MIRPVQLSDVAYVSAIYNYYVSNTVITFEEVPVSIAEMERRIDQTIGKFPWLIYEEDQQVVGYAYATAWRQRSAYRFAEETTIYLESKYTGKGIGSKLYKQLLQELNHMDFHCAIGGIALPNKRSIALHEKLGFKKVAHFKEVGFKFNQWIDVGY